MSVNVIMVDEQDVQTGVVEKMEAHREGILHRAFSVLVFNAAGEMLLQQRAHDKYHSGGLWSNSCCSHPLPGEQTEDACTRRLQEELGMHHTNFNKVGSLHYNIDFDNGLIEHEFDHVYEAHTEVAPLPHADEIAAVRFISLDELRQEMESNDHFTVWFRLIMEKFYNF